MLIVSLPLEPSLNDEKNAELDEREIARRRDEAIRRALNAPPKPNKEYVGKGDRKRRSAVESRKREK